MPIVSYDDFEIFLWFIDVLKKDHYWKTNLNFFVEIFIVK